MVREIRWGLHVPSRECAFGGHDFGQLGHPTRLRCFLVRNGALPRGKLILAVESGIATRRRSAIAPITSTAVYTALAPNRFKDFWRD